MTVTTFQHFNFGSIILGNIGGSVIIDPHGVRTSTGDIILYGSTSMQAIFEVKANPGTLITIQFGPPTQLTNGSYSMTLELGPTDPVSPFVNRNNVNNATQVRVGGTLTVGNALQNPAGNYSGSFFVTFIQQ